MLHVPFRIDLRNLPPEGRDIAGTVPPAFFALAETDDVKALSPLTYELNIIRDDKDLVVTGHVAATFELMCGRCLQRFQQHIEMDDYQTEISVDDPSATIDLTESIREDILLALPSYPRCEDGNVETRECPAQGKFEPATDESAPDEPAEARAPGVWNVLDQLKNR